MTTSSISEQVILLCLRFTVGSSDVGMLLGKRQVDVFLEKKKEAHMMKHYEVDVDSSQRKKKQYHYPVYFIFSSTE